MKNIIVDFDKEEALNVELVGGKARALSVMKRNGINIPDFFCISSQCTIEIMNSTLFKQQLKLKFNILKTLFGSVIVRSSANLEDSKSSVFPGIFISKKNITTFSELENAIKAVFLSKETKGVQYYCTFKKIDINNIKLAVVIQREIKPDFSGVLFTKSPLTNITTDDDYYVEIIQGKNDLMLAGLETGIAFKINKFEVLPINNNFSLPKNLLKNLWGISYKIKTLFKDNQDIEWALCNKEIFILQARPYIETQSKSTKFKEKSSLPKTLSKKLFPNEKEIGLKGAAMEFFIKNKFFRAKTVLIYPYSTYETIKKKLFNLNNIQNGITIRYSYGDSIGMPRLFAKDITDAIEKIKQTWQKEWLIIVHEYFIVNNSFELYIDDDNFFVEHIPGMWESESDLEPDVILNEKGKTTFMRYTHARNSKQVFYDSIKKVEYAPCSKEQLRNWEEKIILNVSRLRTFFKGRLPLNIHFIENESKNLLFLNIRKTQKINRNAVNKSFFHVVSDMDSLQNWNGKQDILFQIPIERGYERMLELFTNILPQNLKTIYVNFGVLSHPAIMLRELGINPIPVYLNHEIFN